jgi:hypothetical protein
VATAVVAFLDDADISVGADKTKLEKKKKTKKEESKKKG